MCMDEYVCLDEKNTYIFIYVFVCEEGGRAERGTNKIKKYNTNKNHY